MLSVDEVFRALECMALEKSPGSDGLSAEFYHAFWHTLGAYLVDVLNDSFSSGTLPPSLSFSRRATVSNVKIGTQLVYLTLIINSVLWPTLVASIRFYIILLIMIRPAAYPAASLAKMSPFCTILLTLRVNLALRRPFCSLTRKRLSTEWTGLSFFALSLAWVLGSLSSLGSGFCIPGYVAPS